MPNQDLSKPDTHVIETVDCRNLTLRDLSVHGAYLTMGNTNEQVHGITINQGSEDIVVEHVRVFQSAGDGIRLLGRPEDTEHGIPANKVRRIWVEGCRIIQNKRTGVAFQRAVELVWVRNCLPAQSGLSCSRRRPAWIASLLAATTSPSRARVRGTPGSCSTLERSRQPRTCRSWTTPFTAQSKVCQVPRHRLPADAGVCPEPRGRRWGSSPLVGLDQLPAKAVLVGGAASRGGVAPGTGASRVLVGLGDPNQNNVVGNVGDIYQRVDTTPGPRLFVKEEVIGQQMGGNAGQ